MATFMKLEICCSKEIHKMLANCCGISNLRVNLIV